MLEIDTDNHVAVVQPGVTLAELDGRTAEFGLCYPVRPGEQSASVGGTIGTNVRLDAVDRRLRGHPGSRHRGGPAAEVPCRTRRDGAGALRRGRGGRAGRAALAGRPAGGLDPLALEYVDMLTMAAMTTQQYLGLGIPAKIRDTALGCLVVVLEADVETLGAQLLDLGAADVHALPSAAARQLIEARERVFWAARSAGADEVVDIVVPHASLPRLLADAGRQRAPRCLPAGREAAGRGPTVAVPRGSGRRLTPENRSRRFSGDISS
ncbi:FAD-binding protein [Streptomyces sp. NPDC051554]|uniref:FAD-binding protein n=1 Tax=Streptomyces sp. NPDC051554 TaxID=3365656 RepID=UPI003792AE0D